MYGSSITNGHSFNGEVAVFNLKAAEITLVPIGHEYPHLNRSSSLYVTYNKNILVIMIIVVIMVFMNQQMMDIGQN